MAKKYEICFADEISVGGRRIVNVAGREIGIFNVDGSYYAVRNSCPHRGAPLCKGVVDGYVRGDEPGQFEFDRQGEILRCPWHGWEFELKTGQSVFNPDEVWARSYEVSVTESEIAAPLAPLERKQGIETYVVSVETPAEQKRPVIVVHL